MAPRFYHVLPALLCLTLLHGQAGSAQRQSGGGKTYPIIDAATEYLLGASSGRGQWVSGDKARGSVKTGTTYRLYSPFKRLGTAVGGRAESRGAPCEDTLFVTLKGSGKKHRPLSVPLRMPSEKVPDNEPAFAMATPWNALPRVPVILSSRGSVYTTAVTAYLKQKGIKTPAEIKQIWRVDLEGDGTDEVLITATRHHGNHGGQSMSADAKAGDYSVVLLRKLVRGKVVTIVLEEEYHLKDKTFSAPNVFGLAAVLDLDGDGKMEVLTRGRYYEGDWLAMYQVTPQAVTNRGRIKPRLTTGCGA